MRRLDVVALRGRRVRDPAEWTEMMLGRVNVDVSP